MNLIETTANSTILSLQRSLLFLGSGFISLQESPPPPPPAAGKGLFPEKLSKEFPKLLPSVYSLPYLYRPD